LNLPKINDWQQDFCSLFYDSGTLGSGYWTNNTDSGAVQDLNQLYWKSAGETVANSFLAYEKDANRIKISIKRDDMMSYVGFHQIDFRLFDVNSGQSTTGVATFNITIIEEYIPITPTRIKKEVKPVEPVVCTAEIVEVTHKGLVYIDFNKEMATNFNLSWINTTTVDMYIEPADDWHVANDLYKEPSINFTWSVVSFIGHRLTI
jgi:hypothetical protein